MNDSACVKFLQWALPRLQMRWSGFRKVRGQVCKRIQRRLRELGLSDVEAYRAYLDVHPDEWRLLDQFCRISISRFYRDRGVFDYLRNQVLPTLARTAKTGDDTLKCWSAGCASGEEVYTLKFIWELQLRSQFPEMTLGVLATDSDPHMLERVRRGCYPLSSLKDLPQQWLSTAFTQSDGLFCVKPEFRGDIELSLQDIRHELPPGQFQLIFCRHLAFTYFDQILQSKTLDRLAAKLAAGGILVTGKQESLPHLPSQLEECERHLGAYQKVCPPMSK